MNQSVYLIIFIFLSLLFLGLALFLFPRLFLTPKIDLDEGRPGLYVSGGPDYGITGVTTADGKKVEITFSKECQTIDFDVLYFANSQVPFQVLNVSYRKKDLSLLKLPLPSKTVQVRVLVRKMNGVLYSSHPFQDFPERRLKLLALLEALCFSFIALLALPCFMGFYYGEIAHSFFGNLIAVLLSSMIGLLFFAALYFLFRAILFHSKSGFRSHGGLKA